MTTPATHKPEGLTLHDEAEELAALYRVCVPALFAGTTREAYPALLDAVADALGSPMVAIECLDRRDRHRLVRVAARGFPSPDAGLLEIPLDQTLSGVAITSGSPVIESDPRSRPEHAHPALTALELEAYAAFPLDSDEGPKGALVVADTGPFPSVARLQRLGPRVAAIVAAYTERVATEEALRRDLHQYRTQADELHLLNQELESFAASVSHDLRAPLRTMQGFAHMLLGRHGDALSPEARDYVRRIIAAGHESEQLITSLLEYGRVSLAEVGLEPVSLQRVAEAARRQLRADIETSGARVEIGGPLPTVLGTYAILVQVVANLLSNAMKFVPEGMTPEIAVRPGRPGPKVRLWVEDNGIGVPQGSEELIFRAFERLPSVGDRPGTGVGLAIVRRGMQRMGGACGVVARDNGGSAFWIDLLQDRRHR